MAVFVFVGHEASLTGAPYAQLYLIQWLRENTNHTVELILLRGGPLLGEFKKVANVHVLHPYDPEPVISQRIIRKIDHLTNMRMRRILSTLKKAKPALIFANTAPSLEFSVRLKEVINAPLVINIHELEATFFYIDPVLFSKNVEAVDFFIPCSQAVKDFYKTFCDIADDKTRIVYDFAGKRPADVTTALSIRQELGIPLDAKIVGAVGTFGWRKGSDLFLQVAQDFQRRDQKDVFFVWVGGDTRSQLYKEIKHDIRLMGLSDRVLFVGSRIDLQGFYAAFDTFLLTSREDPFPLVCMEAALAGCPIICFDQGGGMPEFVQQDAGFVVPYMDTQAMSEKAASLIRDKVMRDTMGAVAKKRAEDHHNIEVIGPQMYDIIQQFI